MGTLQGADAPPPSSRTNVFPWPHSPQSRPPAPGCAQRVRAASRLPVLGDEVRRRVGKAGVQGEHARQFMLVFLLFVTLLLSTGTPVHLLRPHLCNGTQHDQMGSMKGYTGQPDTIGPWVTRQHILAYFTVENTGTRHKIPTILHLTSLLI